MKSIDADNLSKLQEIYNNTPQIQFTGRVGGSPQNDENNMQQQKGIQKINPILNLLIFREEHL